MTTYFGFAVADGMFSGNCILIREVLTPEEGAEIANRASTIVCLNPSHRSTIQVMEKRFGIVVPIPETPPKVSLGVGDQLVVMGVRGLPRRTAETGSEYSDEEVASATLSFARYTVSVS